MFKRTLAGEMKDRENTSAVSSAPTTVVGQIDPADQLCWHWIGCSAVHWFGIGNCLAGTGRQY